MPGGTQAAVDRGNLAEDLAFIQISEQQGSAVRRIDKASSHGGHREPSRIIGKSTYLTGWRFRFVRARPFG